MQEKYQKIMESKLALPIEQICVGLPAEFSNYLHYCRSLRFEDKPDYPYLRQVFVDLMQKEGYDYDYVFDWTIVDKIEKPIQGNTIDRKQNQYQPSMIVGDGTSNNGDALLNQSNLANANNNSNGAAAVKMPSKFKNQNKSESEEEDEDEEQEEEDSSEEEDDDEEAKDKEGGKDK